MTFLCYLENWIFRLCQTSKFKLELGEKGFDGGGPPDPILSILPPTFKISPFLKRAKGFLFLQITLFTETFDPTFLVSKKY